MKHSISVNVKVISNAPFNRIDGWEEGRLRVRISAVAEKGRANERLIQFLAEVLEISPRQISLAKGSSSRLKKIVIEDLKEEEFLKKLPRTRFQQ